MTREETRRLFQYRHLPPHLQEVSKDFAMLADVLHDAVPDSMGTYRTKALNSLWAAKNWAVAAIAQKEDAA